MQTAGARQSRVGLLGGRSPLVRFQSDERLIALMRSGSDAAFEQLFERYRARLLAFCRHMLGSKEDAEDVLQEVFAASYNAIRADDRNLNVRPWLYRIARNRCLNHLRRPRQEARETMDEEMHDHGISTADLVHRRADLRHLLLDIQKLPESQRTALLLREIDALSYEQIAEAMENTVPSVKSLLVRARMSLAEAAEARRLNCGDVRLELAEVAEGLKKATPAARRHLRDCEQCQEYRTQLRKTAAAMAVALPLGPVMIVKKLVLAKLGLFAGGGAAGGGAAGGATAAGGGAAAAGGAASGAAAGAAASGAAAGGLATGGGLAAGGVTAVATKAVAVTAATALLAGSAVEVRKAVTPQQPQHPPALVQHHQPKPAFDSGGQAAATLPPVAEVKQTLKAIETKAKDAGKASAADSGTTGDQGTATAGDGTTATGTGATGLSGAVVGATGAVGTNGSPGSPQSPSDTGGAALPPHGQQPPHGQPAPAGSGQPPTASTQSTQPAPSASAPAGPTS
jgi:RNA polymerase sigma factor (sigma-70 family)